MSEITKESRADRAIICHNKGYNCAQSVAFAFLDKVDIDPETLFKVTEGLGLGMGGMEGTCGAISAAAVLAGLKISTAALEKPNSKGRTYKASKACISLNVPSYFNVLSQRVRTDSLLPRTALPV